MTTEERLLLNETRETLHELKDKLDDIEAILRGDEYRYAKGLVLTIKDHEDRIKKLEILKDRATWTVLGLSVPAGFGLVDLFRMIFGRGE